MSMKEQTDSWMSEKKWIIKKFHRILNEISKRLCQEYNDVSLNASSSVVGLWSGRPHRIGKTAGAADMHFPNHKAGGIGDSQW